MDTPTNAFLPARHRVLRQNLPPFKTDLDSPIPGPSRLSPLIDLTTPAARHDDMDSTPRLTVKSSLPSPQAITPTQDAITATPSDRLRALLRKGQPSPAANQTQLLDVRAPSMSSGNDSDFEPPPRWHGGQSQASSSSIRVKSLFAETLRDTPEKKRGRRNSIDASEMSDSPRVERVAHERSKAKGKRKSLSDDEGDKSAGVRQQQLSL